MVILDAGLGFRNGYSHDTQDSIIYNENKILGADTIKLRMNLICCILEDIVLMSQEFVGAFGML